MTVFWLVVACLIGAALLFVVPPLFQRRDSVAHVKRSAVNVSIYKNQLSELETELAAGELSQENYHKSRQEIERRLLEDAAVVDRAVGQSGRGLGLATAAMLVVVVPAFALLMYQQLGTPAAMDPAVLTAEPVAPHGDQTNMAQQIQQMVGKLAQRLQENPSDIEGWVMLARSYSVLGRYDEAVSAYQKAIQFVGEDATLLADYADAIAMASGESLDGKPLQLLQQALTIDPNNQKALWLMGTALFERGDFGGAISHWQRLHDLLPFDSEDAQVMEANIAEAKGYYQRQLKGEFGPAPTTQQPVEQAMSSSAQLKAQLMGRVSLSPELQSKVDPNDTLFIFAKAATGPAMPLAIIRTQAGELPLEFTLDESMAMMPTMSLANFDQVIVGARVSKSGNAIAQSGDLQGLSEAISVGSRGLDIRIDSVVP